MNKNIIKMNVIKNQKDVIKNNNVKNENILK